MLSEFKEQLNHYFYFVRDETRKVVYITYYDSYNVL